MIDPLVAAEWGFKGTVALGGALLHVLFKSAVKGIKSDYDARFLAIELSSKNTADALVMARDTASNALIMAKADYEKASDQLREDVEKLKSNYWSKTEQAEFRREMLDQFKHLNDKLDNVLGRFGNNN